MIEEMKDLIMTNADEQAWLPELLGEYLSSHRGISREDAISILSAAIMELATSGMVGVCAHRVGVEDSYRDLSIEETSATLNCNSHWAYGKVTDEVYSLFGKKTANQDHF